jgi:hypothetical protein
MKKVIAPLTILVLSVSIRVAASTETVLYNFSSESSGMNPAARSLPDLPHGAGFFDHKHGANGFPSRFDSRTRAFRKAKPNSIPIVRPRPPQTLAAQFKRPYRNCPEPHIHGQSGSSSGQSR